MKKREELYYNRELTWLEFNRRVIEEAVDETNPILERLKFLAIASSNLDEFFMIRVAGLEAQALSNCEKKCLAGYSTLEQLFLTREKAREIVSLQYDYLHEKLNPLLKEEGIEFALYNELDNIEKEEADFYFIETVFSVLTPVAVGGEHNFPHLITKSLNVAVELLDGNSVSKFSIVQVPSILKRYLRLGSGRFILLEELIIANLEKLFYGYKIKEATVFRVTRNADFKVNEEEVSDLLIEIEKSLKERDLGFPVRLEISTDISEEVKLFLMNSLDVGEEKLYYIDGAIDLTFFMDFLDGKEYDCLRFDKRKGKKMKILDNENLFDILKKRDLMLHHPYESFAPVIDFIKMASEDDGVLAIKQTLYRVSGGSPIVEALITAAENGKQVTVVIEVQARFDEKRNIEWARKLEKAGCHVIHGVPGVKTHAKVLLVVRREEGGIKRYVHLSTGNYHDKTAKLYTDIGMFTSREEYCSDISKFFNSLTGFSELKKWEKLSVAPYELRETLYSLIEKEIYLAKNGKEGRIIAKMNSLVDKGIIDKLYEASKAGVKIDLIVRGICCLKSKIDGVSENINVISIVGRYLEHSRIYYFGNGGESKMFLASADWMTRNLEKRFEVMFPVEDNGIKKDLKEILQVMLSDTEKARIQIKNEISYKKVKSEHMINSQEYFCGEVE